MQLRKLQTALFSHANGRIGRNYSTTIQRFMSGRAHLPSALEYASKIEGILTSFPIASTSFARQGHENTLVTCVTRGLITEGKLVAERTVMQDPEKYSPRALAASLALLVPSDGTRSCERVFARIDNKEGHIGRHLLDRVIMHLLEFHAYDAALLSFKTAVAYGVDISNDVHVHLLTEGVKHGMPELVGTVWDRLREKGLQPSLDCINSFLEDMSAARSWNDVVAILDELINLNLTPSSETLFHITVLARHFNQIDHLKDILVEFRKLGVEPDMKTSIALVNCFALNEYWNASATEGMAALNRVENSHVGNSGWNRGHLAGLNIGIFSGLILALLKCNKHSKAFDVWSRISHLDQVTSSISPETYEELIQGLLEHELWAAIVDAHQAMLQHKITTSERVLHAVAKACEHVQNYEHLHRTILFHLGEGLPVAQSLSNAFLDASIAVAPHQMRKLIRMLRKRGVFLDMLHVVRSINSNLGGAQGADIVLDWLQSDNNLSTNSQNINRDSQEKLAECASLCIEVCATTQNYTSCVSLVKYYPANELINPEIIKQLSQLDSHPALADATAMAWLHNYRIAGTETDLTVLESILASRVPDAIYSKQENWIHPDDGDALIVQHNAIQNTDCDVWLQLWELTRKGDNKVQPQTLCNLVACQIMGGHPITALRMLMTIPSPQFTHLENSPQISGSKCLDATRTSTDFDANMEPKNKEFNASSDILASTLAKVRSDFNSPSSHTNAPYSRYQPPELLLEFSSQDQNVDTGLTKHKNEQLIETRTFAKNVRKVFHEAALERDYKQSHSDLHSFHTVRLSPSARTQMTTGGINFWNDKIESAKADIPYTFAQGFKGKWVARMVSLGRIMPSYQNVEYLSNIVWQVCRLGLPLTPAAASSILTQLSFLVLRSNGDARSKATARFSVLLLLSEMDMRGITWFDSHAQSKIAEFATATDCEALRIWANGTHST